MATFTTRLGLRKPAGSDTVNVTADLDDNYDKIDTAIGFERVSSFPVSPYTGKPIHRSDQNDNVFFYNGSGWIDLQQKTLYAAKTSDQTVNNSATLVNDSELAITNARINCSYIVDLICFYTSTTATPDLKFQFTLPSGASIKWFPGGLAPSETAANGTIRMEATTSGTRTVGTIAATEVAFRLGALLVMGANTGTVQFQWAQNTATAENTIVKAFSILSLTRL